MKWINAAFAAVLALLCGATQAQSTWPAKPITLIVPFPPGGGTDAFARPLSAHLSKQLGKQVIIDNRGGAGGTVGASIAAKAAPDGYTFFIGAVHHTIAPSFYPKLDYNITTDLVPLTVIANPPQILVINPKRVEGGRLPVLHDVPEGQPGQAQLRLGGQRHLAPPRRLSCSSSRARPSSCTSLTAARARRCRT